VFSTPIEPSMFVSKRIEIESSVPIAGSNCGIVSVSCQFVVWSGIESCTVVWPASARDPSKVAAALMPSERRQGD
jgi:hypothetical protein